MCLEKDDKTLIRQILVRNNLLTLNLLVRHVAQALTERVSREFATEILDAEMSQIWLKRTTLLPFYVRRLAVESLCLTFVNNHFHASHDDKANLDEALANFMEY